MVNFLSMDDEILEKAEQIKKKRKYEQIQNNNVKINEEYKNYINEKIKLCDKKIKFNKNKINKLILELDEEINKISEIKKQNIQIKKKFKIKKSDDCIHKYINSYTYDTEYYDCERPCIKCEYCYKIDKYDKYLPKDTILQKENCFYHFDD